MGLASASVPLVTCEIEMVVNASANHEQRLRYISAISFLNLPMIIRCHKQIFNDENTQMVLWVILLKRINPCAFPANQPRLVLHGDRRKPS